MTHRFWQHQLSHLLEEKEWTTEIEKLDCDIYAEKNGDKLAVEVALSTDDREVQHVKDRFKQDIDHVIIAVPKQSYIDVLTEKLEENEVDMERVDVRLLQELNRSKKLPTSVA